MSVWRRILCLLAAVFVGFAGALAATDKTLTFSPEFITLGLFAMAIAALALAAWPSGADWSRRRRTGAALVALAWALIGGPVLLVTIAVAGCVCGPGGPTYVPPAPLGIDTRHWIVYAVLTGPVLLLIAAALPSSPVNRQAEPQS
jgi:hypothetical protein